MFKRRINSINEPNGWVMMMMRHFWWPVWPWLNERYMLNYTSFMSMPSGEWVISLAVYIAHDRRHIDTFSSNWLQVCWIKRKTIQNRYSPVFSMIINLQVSDKGKTNAELTFSFISFTFGVTILCHSMQSFQFHWSNVHLEQQPGNSSKKHRINNEYKWNWVKDIFFSK